MFFQTQMETLFKTFFMAIPADCLRGVIPFFWCAYLGCKCTVFAFVDPHCHSSRDPFMLIAFFWCCTIQVKLFPMTIRWRRCCARAFSRCLLASCRLGWREMAARGDEALTDMHVFDFAPVYENIPRLTLVFQQSWKKYIP